MKNFVVMNSTLGYRKAVQFDTKEEAIQYADKVGKTRKREMEVWEKGEPGTGAYEGTTQYTKIYTDKGIFFPAAWYIPD